MAKDPAFLFYPNDWKTPNTYDRNFAIPPHRSGVYLLVHPILNKKEVKYDYEILYVGSSKNLFRRHKQHEVLRFLNHTYDYIQFYFKETDDHLAVEKILIKQINPKFNIQWR